MWRTAIRGLFGFFDLSRASICRSRALQRHRGHGVASGLRYGRFCIASFGGACDGSECSYTFFIYIIGGSCDGYFGHRCALGTVHYIARWRIPSTDEDVPPRTYTSL
jgi:hypothetical protein